LYKILKLILWLKSRKTSLLKPKSLKLNLQRRLPPRRKEPKLPKEKKLRKANRKELWDLRTPPVMCSLSVTSSPPGTILSSTLLISPEEKL